MTRRFSQSITVLFVLFIFGIALMPVSKNMAEAFGPDRGIVSLSAIESGKLVQSGYYAQVSGYTAAAPFVDRRKKKAVRYIPLRSTPSPTSPIYLIIKCTLASNPPCFETDPLTQMLTAQGYVELADDAMPIEFKSGLKLARNVKYIQPHVDRNDAKTTLLVIGLMFLSILVQTSRDQG